MISKTIPPSLYPKISLPKNVRETSYPAPPSAISKKFHFYFFAFQHKTPSMHQSNTPNLHTKKNDQNEHIEIRYQLLLTQCNCGVMNGKQDGSRGIMYNNEEAV
jgi:hypothetical protein